MNSQSVVEIDDLHVHFALHRSDVSVVQGVDLRLPAGKTVCLVGESGCGKSVTAKAILRVIEHPGRIAKGQVRLHRADGSVVDIAALAAKSRVLRNIRGGDIAMIHQEPMSFLSPLYTIGNQIMEALRLHRKLGKAEARLAAIDMLTQVGMPDPEQRFDRYTFQLSGGQRQRAMIAMALICEPRLLIADEPTTALDVTTQATILTLLKRLQAERNMAVLFITHDLGVVREVADEVAVMYSGKIVEQGPVDQVLGAPKHPYTRGLLASMPRLDADFKAPLEAIAGSVPPPAHRPAGCAFHPRCTLAVAGLCNVQTPPLVRAEAEHLVLCHAHGPQAHLFQAAAIAMPRLRPQVVSRTDTPRTEPLLRVQNLSRHFPIKKGFLERTVGHVRAVDSVSFDIVGGETLGLVGESGCGKSTLGQTLVGLHSADGGSVSFNGGHGEQIDVLAARGAAAKRLRTDIRMIFQDPSGSLNPRMRVRDIIGEVLDVEGTLSRSQIDDRVEMLLTQVGLSPDYAARYPHAFSGGQRQRIAIARALACEPKLVIADEAVSALDVSVQSQITNLLQHLQRSMGLTYLFVSHDLGVVANISDRVAVMYAGRIVEIGDTEAIFRRPSHPYTEALLAAIPGRGTRPERASGIDGQVPLIGAGDTGCAFASRCPYAQPGCRSQRPELRPARSGQAVACLRADELSLQTPVQAA